jgi:hypothetical protein
MKKQKKQMWRGVNIAQDLKVCALDTRHSAYHKTLRKCYGAKAVTEVKREIAETGLRFWAVVLFPRDAPPYTSVLSGFANIEALTDEITEILYCGSGLPLGNHIMVMPRLRAEDREFLYAAVDQAQAEMLAECEPMGSA